MSFSLAASLLAQSELTAVHHLTKGEVLYDGWNSAEHNHQVSWVFLSVHSLDVAQDKITAKTSHSWMREIGKREEEKEGRMETVN